MPAYHSSRLNDSTHLVIHHDDKSEFPCIYVKLYRELSLVVVFDTGCGGKSNHDGHDTQDLKSFIEAEILTSTGLSAGKSATEFDWMVICTHCHFDHIGGIQPFADAGADILVSAHDRDFLSRENLPANSLCPAFGIDTPEFEISHFAADGESIRHKGHDLGLQTLHTPGHTPDSMAIYDQAENWLFVGDTLYQCVAEMPWEEEQAVPIVFPLQGDWLDWQASLKKLLRFTETQNAKQHQQVRIACGHTTSDVLAVELLRMVIGFGKGVADGSVPTITEFPGNEVMPGGSLGNEIFVLWQDHGKPPFSMIAPKRFRDDFGLLKKILRALKSWSSTTWVSGAMIGVAAVILARRTFR